MPMYYQNQRNDIGQSQLNRPFKSTSMTTIKCNNNTTRQKPSKDTFLENHHHYEKKDVGYKTKSISRIYISLQENI